MRKLATVRRISDLSPIPGADKIELARVDGWECVVKKGEFKVGDPCVYFEIDSVLPKGEEWSQFMKDRKYRVRTARFKKQLSQGLALPVSILPHSLFGTKERFYGLDVTRSLGVTKYDPDALKELQECGRTRKKATSIRSWLQYVLGRDSSSTKWPYFLTKTDEERVQNIPNLPKFLRSAKALYSTEKLHGQSATYYLKKKEGILCKILSLVGKRDHCWEFGVCSRNYRIPKRNNSSWWEVEAKYNLEDALRSYCSVYDCELAIQGEIIGPGICGNQYQRSSYEFYVFTILDLKRGVPLNLEEKQAVCSSLSLEMPPLRGMVFVEDLIKEEDPRRYLLEMADGASVLCITQPAVKREGLVFRNPLDDTLSFKAISNNWLEGQE